jgi:hypothetical protein
MRASMHDGWLLLLSLAIDPHCCCAPKQHAPHTHRHTARRAVQPSLGNLHVPLPLLLLRPVVRLTTLPHTTSRRALTLPLAL